MFVDRVNGQIVATNFSQQRKGQEELADDAAEVVAFLARLAAPPSAPIAQISSESFAGVISELAGVLDAGKTPKLQALAKELGDLAQSRGQVSQ